MAQQVSADDIERWIGELIEAELACLYTVQGKPYLELIDCYKALRKDVAVDERFPSPDQVAATTCTEAGDDPGRSVPGAEAPTQPNPTQPTSAAKATARKRRQDEIWDAVVDLFGLKPATTTEKSRVGRVVRDLKLKNATPGSIAAVSSPYRREWPDMAFTPEALLKHWDQFAHAPPEMEADADAAVDRTNQLLDSIHEREIELAGSER